MAKGKGGEGKEGKSSYVPVVVAKGNTGFVRVNLKLVNWTFDNQVVTLRVTAPLHSLARRIIEKHGHVRDLTLYKGQINPASIMADMDAPLASFGFEGADSSEEAKPVNVSGAARAGGGWSWELELTVDGRGAQVYYDFKSVIEATPLLLKTPTTGT